MKPRDYQNDAHNALWQHIHTRWDLNPLVILPTGTGKSLNIAMFNYHALTAYPHVKIVCITHVKELIESNFRTQLKLWPQAPAGIYSAGLGHRDPDKQITFAGIQTVAKRAASFGKVNFLLVDEAHRISDSETAYYQRFINDLKKKNPNLVVIGFTATDYRMKTGRLTEGKLFDHVCYDGSDGEAFVWFIQNYYLIKLKPIYPGFQLDSDTVKIKSGEFDLMGASKAMHEQNILERAVDTTIAVAKEQNRQCNLTFCQSIADADEVADMFQAKGYDVYPVHSRIDNRDEVLEAYRRGDIWGVTNQSILTTGFDNPRIDLITMLRLTRSPGLWVQMLGRGTRPCFAPGYDINTFEGRRDAVLASHKQDCIVLDFVGNTQRLGPINYPKVPSRARKKGGGGDMARACPQCNTLNHISVRNCEECGYEFPPPERIQTNPSENELVLDLNNMPPREPVYEVIEVDSMITSYHKGKPGKLDTMRVDYYDGSRRTSAWVCIKHEEGSWARRKAEDWWQIHGGEDCPTDLNEAVVKSKDLMCPMFIKVKHVGKFPEIVDYDFRGTAFNPPPELGGPPLKKKVKKLDPVIDDDDIPF